MELGERFGVQLSEDAVARVNDAARPAAARRSEAAETGAARRDRRADARAGALAARRAARSRSARARPVHALDRCALPACSGCGSTAASICRRRGRICWRPTTRATSIRSRSPRCCRGRGSGSCYWAGWIGLLFRGPLTRLFSRASQVLPVDPEHGLTSTLPLGRAALERGAPLSGSPRARARPTAGCTASCPGSACCSSAPACRRCRCGSTAPSRPGRRGSGCRGRLR